MLLFSEGNEYDGNDEDAHIIIIIIYLLMLPRERSAWSHRKETRECASYTHKYARQHNENELERWRATKWKWSQAAVGFMVYIALDRNTLYETTWNATLRHRSPHFFASVFLFAFCFGSNIFSRIRKQTRGIWCKYRLWGLEWDVSFCAQAKTRQSKWWCTHRKRDQMKESERDNIVFKYTHESLWKLKIWFQLRLNCILSSSSSSLAHSKHIHFKRGKRARTKPNNLVPYVKANKPPKK